MKSSLVCRSQQSIPNEFFPLVPQGVASRWRVAASRAIARAAVPIAAWRGPRKNGCFGILAYHRVVPEPSGFPAPTHNVPPEAFRRQLEGLLARGYRPVTLSDAVDAHRKEEPLPAEAFVVTFDDAYESVFRYALPVLESLAVPATLFVATAYVDYEGVLPFDDWVVAGSQGVPSETWRTMTTDQCLAALHSGVMDLACHTHIHRDFRGQPELFREDMHRSLDCLRECFGVVDPPMAFPYGLNDPAMLDMTRELGVSCALTTFPRRAKVSDAPHGWGRFTAEPFDTGATLAAKVSGWHEFCLERLGGRSAASTRPEPAE